MGGPSAILEFDPFEPAPVLAHMDALAAAGRGWINFTAIVDDEEAADGAGIFRVFSGRGPSVPMCTWVAREQTRRQVAYVSIGVQHGSGPKAVDRLAEHGHTLPGRWLVLQDHPKRGLVVALPVTEPNPAVLGWLTTAARLLSVRPLPARWQADVYP